MRTRPDDRGSISIWLATSSFVMLVLVGLAVDLGGQVHAKERAHDIAAEAARAGGEQLQAAPAVQGRYVAVDTASARQAAQQYLDAAGVNGTDRTSGLVKNPPNSCSLAASPARSGSTRHSIRTRSLTAMASPAAAIVARRLVARDPKPAVCSR